MGYDLVIRGGSVVDGTRLPRFNADVGIRDGRVTKVGRIDSSGDARVLDAAGCIVAPGFVDLHTHYDAQIHWDPYCTISGWHGVTSVTLGNCGFGFAPCKVADRDRSLQMMTRTEQIPFQSMKEGMEWDWITFPEWLDNLQRIPKGVNVISYMPVNPLLIYVMGLEASKSRPATRAEQKEMQRLLHEAMDAGACGFSIQRMGKNSFQADYDGTPMPTDTMVDEDILVLADVLRERDEGFMQITQATCEVGEEARIRDKRFVETLAARAQRPLIHNAIAAIDEDHDNHRRDLAWLRECNERGLRIFGQGANQRSWYQYTFEHWNMYDSSPAWNNATVGTHDEKMAKLADPEIRKQMIAEHASLVTAGAGGPIEDVQLVSNGGNTDLDCYVGKTVGEIAEAERKHVVDAMLDIAVAGNLKPEFRTGTSAGSFTNDEIVGELMRDQYVLAGISDGGAHTKFFTGGSYTTDLLTWLVRDTGQLTLEEAHYHLSYLPAQAAGFTDRGFLRVGAPADLVVYDLERLKRVPEWEFEVAHDFPANEWRRVQRSEGYRYTLVNGEITFKEGECTGATPGKLLRNGLIGQV